MSKNVIDSNRPPRVLRVIARLNVGGPAKHVVWLTTGLRERGYETALLTGSIPSGEGDMTYFATSNGVVPEVIPGMSREVSFRDLMTIWRLYRKFVHFRPDIVHTHTAKGGAVGRMAGLLYRWLTPSTLWGRPRPCKFVHTFHGHVFHSYFSRWKTRLFLAVERLLARLATDRIVVISPEQFREIHQLYGVGRAEQFAVIPLGLDLQAFAEAASRRPILRREWSIADDEVLVGIVGRLTEIKNHALFLHAIARYLEVNGNRAKVRFVVIGDGHLRAALEAQARALNLGERVFFAGQRDDPENFYPALDFVALTSLNEGTPLTLLEAMANARPVVSTAVGGVSDVVGTPVAAFPDKRYSVHERGLLAASQDVDGFVAALTRLITDPALRQELGDAGPPFVIQNYSRERLVRDIARLYEQLTGSPGCTRVIGTRSALMDSTL